jgi:RimJ/RimL family protein N-acetyltransferase
MEVFLETERLVLRRFTESDADNLAALNSDPEVLRFLTGGAPIPRDVVENDILPACLRSYDGGDRYGCWAAVEKSTGDFLGWFGFRPSPGADPDEPELGYRLRKAAWGKGYATEASRALIRKGFTESGVRRVVASTYQDNVASRRVMEKAGLKLVRTYRFTPENLSTQDTYIASQNVWEGDEVEYALEKADWEWQEAAGVQQAAIPGNDGDAG